jgi:lipoprotein NlpD
VIARGALSMSRTASADPIFVPRALRLAVLALAIVIAGCAARTRAPVEELPTRPPPPPQVAAPTTAPAPTRAPELEPRPQTYTVKRGDTLYKIALDNGLDYRELAAWNGIENINVIREGQTLRLSAPGEAAPAAAGVTTMPLRGAPPVVTGDVRPPPSPPATPLVVPGARNSDNYKTQPKAVKEPYSEQALREMQRVAAAAPPPPPEPPQVVARAEPRAEPRIEPKLPAPAAPGAADDDKIAWIWPATGKLVTGGSENPNLKGIDIAGRPGQPVVASAAGKVVYAGTGIRGYGKLVIVKHSATWLSAYAHNREILVKEGQQVTKGQPIAEMGNTDADQVMLHFEIRRQGTPVDPLKYLPPA